jgi:hypothetical protein
LVDKPYFFGFGGISPVFNLTAFIELAGDKSLPAFHASKNFHGYTTPRLTHQISFSVGHEIPKCKCGLVPLADPELPTSPNLVPAVTRNPTTVELSILERCEPY